MSTGPPPGGGQRSCGRTSTAAVTSRTTSPSTNPSLSLLKRHKRIVTLLHPACVAIARGQIARGHSLTRHGTLSRRPSHLFGHLLSNRLPGPLLADGKFSDLLGCHRVRVSAKLSKLLLYLCLVHCLAEIYAHLLDDRTGRANRRQQRVPAAGDEARERFRDRRQVLEILEPLQRCNGNALDQATRHSARQSGVPLDHDGNATRPDIRHGR